MVSSYIKQFKELFNTAIKEALHMAALMRPNYIGGEITKFKYTKSDWELANQIIFESTKRLRYLAESHELLYDELAPILFKSNNELSKVNEIEHIREGMFKDFSNYYNYHILTPINTFSHWHEIKEEIEKGFKGESPNASDAIIVTVCYGKSIVNLYEKDVFDKLINKLIPTVKAKSVKQASNNDLASDLANAPQKVRAFYYYFLIESECMPRPEKVEPFYKNAVKGTKYKWKPFQLAWNEINKLKSFEYVNYQSQIEEAIQLIQLENKYPRALNFAKDFLKSIKNKQGKPLT